MSIFFDTPEDANVAKALGFFFKKTTFHFWVDYFPNCVFTEKVKLY